MVDFVVDDQGVPAIVPSGDRRDLIDRVAARVADLVQPTDPPGADEFARALYEQIDEDELRVRAVDDPAAAAVELWRLAEQRAPGTARVRGYPPPRGHSVVAVVVDDMPFIVDSITMAL